jgi:hypothetical protein
MSSPSRTFKRETTKAMLCAPAAGSQPHDRVIALVAERWTNPRKYNVATNPGLGAEPVGRSDDQCPDRLGWVRENNRYPLWWVAEVETEASVTESEARGQWRTYALIGVPFYLVVPKDSGRGLER